MKSTAFRLVCLSLILLFSTAHSHGLEKSSVFNTESLKYESGTGLERCRAKCGRWSGPDVKSLLSEGWKIAGSSPKEVVAEQYWFTPCNTCRPHGCICIGTEYHLERDEPFAGNGTRGRSHGDTGNGTHPVGGDGPEAVHNGLDLLYKEIDALKRENALLKQEIEALRNQLKTAPK